MAEQRPDGDREPAEDKPAVSGREDWRRFAMDMANLIMSVILTVQSLRGH